MPLSILKMPATATLTSDQFYDLCRANPQWQLERTAQGDLVVCDPTDEAIGRRKAHLLIQIGIWNERHQLGTVFDSSTSFHLPNGAARSPGLAWINGERWNQLPLSERQNFPSLAPDFVMELISRKEDMAEVQAKMQEYADNGVQLGWLMNFCTRQVEVYRPGLHKQVLRQPNQLSGDPLLPGFVLKLSGFWY
ncbi:MAG: Uma2 family endonuclease [Cyanobacteria bacterium P01_A01_bin.17]